MSAVSQLRIWRIKDGKKVLRVNPGYTGRSGGGSWSISPPSIP